MSKLTKEDVLEYLRLKELIELRANEVCKEHFKRTHFKPTRHDDRLIRPTTYEGFKGVDLSFTGSYTLKYKWHWFENEYDNSIPIEALWTNFNFLDLVSERNNKILEENKAQKEKELKEKEAIERLELIRLKKKYE